MKGWSCLFHNATWFYTRCTKTFEWHPVIQKVNHVFLKGRNTKCFRVKKPIKQWSSRRKSAPLTSVNHHTPSPIWARSNFWTWMNKTTRLSEVTAPKTDFFYASSIVQKPNSTMITDKYTLKRSSSDAKQSNSRSPTSNLSDKTICTLALSSLTYHH